MRKARKSIRVESISLYSLTNIVARPLLVLLYCYGNGKIKFTTASGPVVGL